MKGEWNTKLRLDIFASQVPYNSSWIVQNGIKDLHSDGALFNQNVVTIRVVMIWAGLPREEESVHEWEEKSPKERGSKDCIVIKVTRIFIPDDPR